MSTVRSHPAGFLVSPVEAELAAEGPHLFFVLGALFGALVLVEWVVFVRFGWTGAVPPVMWHAHEMVYGFAAVGFAGILSAWVPGWSGAPQIRRTRLVLLAGIWLLGRAAMAVSGLLPAWLAAVIDLSFFPALAALVLLPHLAARPERNLPLLGLVVLFWFGNLAMHAEAFGGTFAIAERGARVGIDAYLLLIAIVCGHAVPDATNRFLVGRGSRPVPRRMPVLDSLAVAGLLIYLIGDSVTGMSHSTSAAALAAGGLNAIRLCCWRGYRVLNAPSLLILHLGYLWMVIGLLLEAAVPLTDGVADMAAIHSLTAGAIGTMLLAAIAHESMIHRGGGPHAGPVVLAACGLVSVAAFLRVAALFVPGAFVTLVISSGAIWSLGFFCLAAGYVIPGVAALGHRCEI
jgi:uncharacterized protein involved in response to NO